MLMSEFVSKKTFTQMFYLSNLGETLKPAVTAGGSVGDGRARRAGRAVRAVRDFLKF